MKPVIGIVPLFDEEKDSICPDIWTESGRQAESP